MALLKKTKPRTPERQALADAQAEYTQARANLQQVSETSTALERQASAAREDFVSAEQALKAAPEAAVEFALAQASGTGAERPVSPAEASAALATAKSQREAIRAAQDGLQERLAVAVQAEYWHRHQRAKAAGAVIKTLPEAQKVLADFQRIQRELGEKWQVLLWMEEIAALDLENVPAPWGSDFSPAKRALGQLHQPPINWDLGAPVERSAEFHRLAALYEALQTNPDAELGS